MNIIKSIDQCNMNSIYFCEPIKNNVIINGSFTRILYSSDIFTMNGVLSSKDSSHYIVNVSNWDYIFY